MWIPFKAKGSVLLTLHHLHGGVVHNHAVKRDVWVTGGNFPATLQEQSVTKFPVRAQRSLLTFPTIRKLKYELEYIWYSNSHDVGLVYSGDPAAAFFSCQAESILSNPEGIASRDNLETFHNPGNTLKKRKLEN